MTIFYVDLQPPIVNISETGTSTAGQQYSLICSVTVVPHLITVPTIEWTQDDGSVLVASNGSSLLLHFDPLLTSNGSHYVCMAGVNITGIVSASSYTSKDLVVKSRLFRRDFLACMSLASPQFHSL